MSLKKAIADILRNTPLFIPARTTYSLLMPHLRARRREERADLARITAKVGDALRYPLYGTEGSNKSVLIMGMGRVRFIAQEAVVRKAFELAGYRCRVMVAQDGLVLDAYRRLGSDELVFMDHYQAEMCHEGENMLRRCKTLDEVTGLSVGGIRCGKYAVSTLMRKTRSGTLYLGDPMVREELARALDYSLQSARSAQMLLQKLKPNAVVLVDRGYTPQGEIFDSCIEKSIPVITWNAAHRNDSLMLKRYNRSNRDVHPSSLSESTWTQVRDSPWSREANTIVLQELERCYSSGEWYAEVGTQFNKMAMDRDALIEKLGLDPKRKTVVIFSHIFWDATFFWGTDLFESYEAWFVETVRAACRNTSVNWVVKVHPANIVKDYRDGLSVEHAELVAISREFGKLPCHVKILDAATEINTLSLLKVIDACVTVRGTVGVEAACFGIPVITAGTGRYDGLGFTLDSRSREEYFTLLAHVQDINRLTADQNELAFKHAWGLLIGRPVSLQLFQMRYKDTRGADLEIEFRVSSSDEIKKLPDLKSMAAWILGGEEDYMDWSIISTSTVTEKR